MGKTVLWGAGVELWFRSGDGVGRCRGELGTAINSVGLSPYPPYRSSFSPSFLSVVRLLFPFPICHVGIRVSLLRHIEDVSYMI